MFVLFVTGNFFLHSKNSFFFSLFCNFTYTVFFIPPFLKVNEQFCVLADSSLRHCLSLTRGS